jgi:pimeloyl-ACP methyl ester carboxylesterase
MRIFKRILLVLLVILIVAAAAFTIWAYTPLGPMPEALIAMQSGQGVDVQTSPWLTFAPTGQQPTTGVIIYPGGRVDYRSYAPTARALAEQGYLAVIVPMPFNLAVFGSGKASDVIKAYPETTGWAIGGHSLGGAMAAQYAADHPDVVAGLVFCGAYSAADLSASGLLSSSVYGSLDAAAAKIEDPATTALLPPDTAYVRIEGGNHEQCGWYTGQPSDPPATISRQEQQDRIVEAWAAVLAGIAAAP